MKNSVLYSSLSDLWGTPPELFRLLDEVYDFQLDAASTKQNRLCKNHFTRDDDGLAQDWSGFRRIWLNPPYGRTIGAWMQKAYEESQKGCLVVCLVPARVDTRWWHDWVQNKAQVTFIKGRLRFIRYSDGSDARGGGAPFPSALVIYEPNLSRRIDYSCLPLERKCYRPILSFG
jgi:phage N-6-adenine-methyltransferase